MPYEIGAHKRDLKTRSSPSPAIALTVYVKWTAAKGVPPTTTARAPRGKA
jgi:hypothetical protein